MCELGIKIIGFIIIIIIIIIIIVIIIITFDYFQDSLQSCQWMPDVLVSAEHTRRGLKHDAATVWVENLDEYRVGSGGYKFEVCLRELQNFDGQHKDIKVVSDARIWNRNILCRVFTPVRVSLVCSQISLTFRCKRNWIFHSGNFWTTKL